MVGKKNIFLTIMNLLIKKNVKPKSVKKKLISPLCILIVKFAYTRQGDSRCDRPIKSDMNEDFKQEDNK